MTKEELITELVAVAETYNGDPEVAHAEADDCLLRFIDDAEVTAAWNAIEKWYA